MNVISISYKSAPIEIRSLFAFTEEEQEDFYKTALNSNQISQCVIISTCNRCEIYFEGEKGSLKYMEQLICRYKGISPETALKYFNIYTEHTAVNHLLKVACGIDSMVLGEDEILRQVKDAYNTAHLCGATGFELNTVFKMAVTAAKEIKTVTGLSKTPVSIGTLTANEVFAFPKESKNVLIIGITGKIGSIAAKNILKKPGINLTGTSRRHFEDKLHSSYPDIQLIDFTKRYEYIDEADIIISATSSPHYTVTKDELIRHTHIKKERLFIDLAVPADIDSDVGSLEMCRLFDIDYFRTLSESNNTRRLKEAASAGEYAEKWTDDIIKELEYHRIIESLPQLKSIVENHGLEHLVYSLRKLADRSQTEAARQWFDNYIKEWSR